MNVRRRRSLRTALIATVAGLAAGAMLLTGASGAFAADLPSPALLQQRDDSVATSDALPTVQIDSGYVWAQTMIGNTVYAVGSFSNARAPLAAPGTNLTPRSNILAFDITTGALSSFAPQVNGVIKSIAASADGSRIYIGGAFNSVNGQTRWNFAALDAVTGQLVAGFNPSIGGSGVYGIAVTGDTVYLSGLFTQANGVARKNLAAFATANGALRAWAPTTDLQADAIVVEPGGSHIIAAGRFYRVNDVVQRGLVALDPASGAIDTGWLAPQTIVNGMSSGSNAGKAGIFSLATDASGVYGTGWVYANASVGNLEGTFAAEAGSGEIRWVADCHGDHYGVYSTGETVYATTHTHACETVGLWPEQSPRVHRYIEAYTATAEGVLTRSASAGTTYADWSGTPSPAPYAWYPDFSVGTASGLGQAGLSITGTGDYIAVAGEFTSVNNQRYQGIVRFSTDPSGGAQDGPRIGSADWGAPAVSSAVAGRVRASIPLNWDRDDRDLTYQLLRSGVNGAVDDVTVESGWWTRGSVTLDDTGLSPGATYTYTVRAVDGDGNAVTSRPATVTVAAGESSDYVDAVLDEGATLYYPLGDISEDWAGASTPVFGSGVSITSPGAVEGVTGQTASDFNGNSSGRVSSRSGTPPTEFSLELWFNTTTDRGGKLIGFGNSQTGSSSSYDRHVYMQNNGRLTFGVYPNEVKTVTSSESYDDGEWHHVVATQGQSGITLYVDGALAAQDTAVHTAQNYSGYWRIGGDNLGGWPNQPSSISFSGAIDEVAVYGKALTAGQVMDHYAVGLGQDAPSAAFDSDIDDLSVSFDASASSAEGDASITSYEWDFGDDTTAGSGASPSHTYAEPGAYPVTLTVTDSRGLSGAVTHDVTVQAANVDPTASFTATADGLGVAVNGGASEDTDGEIASYAWDWGDGSDPGAGATANHAYAEPGDYTITLTVTDDRGADATSSEEITVTHADPTAAFTATAATLDVDVDASASSAEDGATLSYEWDWGDGTAAGSGATASHSYGAAGSYTIELTVTDSIGATASTTREVAVSETSFAARDDFERTVASGWGAADTGGGWTTMYGSAAAGSVSGGTGDLDLSAGQTRNMALQTLQLSDSVTTVDYSIDETPATGNTYVGVAARQSSGADYTARAWMRSNGSVWLVVQRSGTVLVSQPLGTTWAAGDDLHLKVQVTGTSPTTIQAKVWKGSSSEPANWQISASDSTAGLQGTGWVSLHAARAGSATSAAAIAFDTLRVLDPAAEPETEPTNADPVAAFTSETSGLSVDVDGSGSSDEDGEIAEYAWNWGDGTPDGSGATASHEYDTAGTYTVRLAVTDDDGATATVEHEVTAIDEPTDPEEPGNVAPTAAFTSAATNLTIAVDAATADDSDGDITAYSWDWGDGTPAGDGVTATHEYAAAGTYAITLTVTDDEDASDSVSADVTVTTDDPGSEFAAADDFARDTTSGWGTADIGGAWSMLAGSSTPASVGDGVGKLTLGAGSTRNIVLSDSSLRDVRISADISLDQAPSTGSSYIGVLARASTADDYIVRVWLRGNGSVWLVLQRGSTVLQTSPVPGITRAAADTFSLEFEVTGGSSTTLSAKLWPAGTTVPTDWQATATDASGLDAGGAVGIHANRAGSATTAGVFTVDSFRVTDLG